MLRRRLSLLMICAVGVFPALRDAPGEEPPRDFSPPPDERQLPGAMRSAMQERPRVTAGREGCDLNGEDERVLQAAVDYIAGLGGGTVEIGAGVFAMRDSLHLRPGVTVRGVPGKTILRKAASVRSTLAIDGDFGEEQITVEDPTGFAVGAGVAIRDDRSGGFHTTVARITGRSGHRLSLSRPLMADCLVSGNARAATVFPVISGYRAEDARVENLVIDGNREANEALNGCRGAGIFLYRSHRATIRGCAVRGYNGDGISFQQSNDVVVEDSSSQGNAALGIHPGSGSQRPIVRRCVARENGTDGLFLCWRVRHGLFEDNVLQGNGRFGVSIGHKDTDNLLRRNIVRANDGSGFFFRNESLGMAAHRNRLEENVIEDNGGHGIRIRGETRDLLFTRNKIVDRRPPESQTQKIGILIEEKVGEVTLSENEIVAAQRVDDRRPSATTIPVGVAKIDITPGFPVRMYGYASRKTPSEGVAGRLHAKALALGGDDGDGPAVLLTVDCGAIPPQVREKVLERLQADTELRGPRFLLCHSHVHSGPDVKGARYLPSEHREPLLRYTEELTDSLEKVARQALAARQLGQLAWAQGKVAFAANRRVLKDGQWVGFGAVPEAPVDHSLPVLRVTGVDGKLLAVLVNYACHSTTLRGDFKKIHGDWAGCAQKFIEADHPGAVAMISIGCGADADPHPHGTVELAEKHGRVLADEVNRLLRGSFTPIEPRLTTRLVALKFPYATPPSSEELRERAKSSRGLRRVLEGIERGDELAPFEYQIATWAFGDDLAMVFFAGEVVVDYALRLRREFDGKRLWITAYTNDVPCYVVSRRLLEEGGYEVRSSISWRISFGRPGAVEPSIEDRVIRQVRALLPEVFRTPRS